MRDQRRCGGKDGRGGAVIRLQPDDFRAFEILLEAQDVFHLRATPGVDRLVVVTDAADVLVGLREKTQPEVLHQVGVLVFVHQNVAEHAVILRQHVGLLAQDLRHVQQQIAEVRGVQCAQPGLVRSVQFARAAAGEVGILRRRHAGGSQPAILPALDHRHQCGRRPSFGVHAFGFHDLLQQAQLVVGIQDGEARRQADQVRVAAQHARAQGVERAEPQAFDRPAEDGADAFAHFAGGLVGEGHREHLARRGAAGQQDMREAGGQDAGLAGAGAGQHQQRAVDGFHRGALFVVEAREVVGHAGTRDAGCMRLDIECGHGSGQTI